MSSVNPRSSSPTRPACALVPPSLQSWRAGKNVERASIRGTRMAGLSLLPQNDPRQALRMRRYLLASGFSLIYLLVLFLYHWEGLIARNVLVRASVLVTSLIAVFYVVFRSGLNLRMRDPSLTALQMMSAVFTMLYVLHEAQATREIFGLFLFVAFMFGMLRLSTRELLVLAAASMAGLAFVIAWHAYGGESGESIRRDIAHWVVLAVTIPWLIQIGGYVGRLREDLADASVKLEDGEDQARHDELTRGFKRPGLQAAPLS